MSSPPPAPPRTGVSVAALYGALWRYAVGARGRLLLATALLVGSTLVKLAVPWLSAQAINALQLGNVDAAWQAARWVGLILLAHVVSWAMHGPGRVLERVVSVTVRQQLSDALYERLTRAPLAWHERQHSGELQHRIAQASQALYQFAQSQFIYLQSVVNFVGPVVALWLLSAGSGAVALAGYAVVAVVVVVFDRVLMRLAAEENQAERHYSAALLEGLGHVGTVLSLRLGGATRALLQRRLLAVFAPLRRSIVMNETKWFSVDMLGLLLTWGLVAAYVWRHRVDGETLLIGSVFMLYQYAQQAGGVLSAMAGHFQSFARTRTDYASADEVWEAPQVPPPGPDVPPGWREMRLEGLVYRHAAREANAAGDTPRPVGLHGLTLTLRRGERIALVGPSGSGKSTLLRVLAGLYEPQGGQLRIDGAVVPELRHPGSVATLLPQEADVFEASVRENIVFDAEPTPAQLEAALKVSAFDEVAAALPRGLDTPISERGFNLSGGQRQRLCLARGVIAADRSSLVLLDEPTSALDALTEARVLDGLRERFPDACVVASIHRLSLLPKFDTVVLMAAGEVVDQGRASDLATRQPLMRQLLRGAERDEASGSATVPATPAAPA